MTTERLALASGLVWAVAGVLSPWAPGVVVALVLALGLAIYDARKSGRDLIGACAVAWLLVNGANGTEINRRFAAEWGAWVVTPSAANATVDPGDDRRQAVAGSPVHLIQRMNAPNTSPGHPANLKCYAEQDPPPTPEPDSWWPRPG